MLLVLTHVGTVAPNICNIAVKSVSRRPQLLLLAPGSLGRALCAIGSQKAKAKLRELPASSADAMATYDSYGGCGWLYRNAVATGSAYWWNRYYECAGY